MDKRLNVLMICIDDLNDWVGCMNGHPNAKTPNIDKLAAAGALFTNAHCQAPLCGPSRASVMTGLRPSSTGIYGMIDDDKIKQDNPVTADVVFLPEYFKNNGYHTMGIGKIFHGHAPANILDESGGRIPGFGPSPQNKFVWNGRINKAGYGNTSTDWGAFPESDTLMPDYHSAQWAIDRLKKDYQQPFFLAVGFLRPHVPWYVPPKWFDLHPLADIETPPYLKEDLDDLPAIALEIDDMPMMPTTEWAIRSGEWPKMIQAYLACISFVDFYIGEILNALENGPNAENTVVVLWSDHGYRMGEKNTFAKHCLWEEATNAPLIFTGPGVQKGTVVSAPVEMLSIYPTLLELCGMESNPQNEGASLIPMLAGKADGLPPSYAITTYGWENHSVRSEYLRYIRYNDGSEEFYDHRNDPNEWNNLATKEGQFRKDMDELKAFLPQKKAPYAVHSSYSFNPYFIEDKKKHSEN
ncbi:sulfatase [Mariniphaga anaerophila]|uniref:sulfatase n=1 Tax=Mariniphaga anaerophila TaxID=1484053 RepID=UPI001C318169|nr:sulfatase [Mariniphaga anaerophila]